MTEYYRFTGRAYNKDPYILECKYEQVFKIENSDFNDMKNAIEKFADKWISHYWSQYQTGYVVDPLVMLQEILNNFKLNEDADAKSIQWDYHISNSDEAIKDAIDTLETNSYDDIKWCYWSKYHELELRCDKDNSI